MRSWEGFSQAPKGRHMNSLGREPQDGGKKKTEAAERRQIPRRDSRSSRFSPGLSPLRGSFIYGRSVPGAHAPGYESFAAPRLTSAGLAIPETLGFHLRRFLGPPHRISDEPNVTGVRGRTDPNAVGSDARDRPKRRRPSRGRRSGSVGPAQNIGSRSSRRGCRPSGSRRPVEL